MTPHYCSRRPGASGHSYLLDPTVHVGAVMRTIKAARPTRS